MPLSQRPRVQGRTSPGGKKPAATCKHLPTRALPHLRAAQTPMTAWRIRGGSMDTGRSCTEQRNQSMKLCVHALLVDSPIFEGVCLPYCHHPCSGARFQAPNGRCLTPFAGLVGQAGIARFLVRGGRVALPPHQRRMWSSYHACARKWPAAPRPRRAQLA